MDRQLHFNLFINSRGHHEASWRHPDASALLARLGPHSATVACVYATRLDALDEGVLSELITLGWSVTADTAV